MALATSSGTIAPATSSSTMPAHQNRSWIPLSFRDFDEKHQFRILSYNILSDEKALKEQWHESCQPKPFRLRKAQIIAEICASDVAALQEVEPAVFEEIKKELSSPSSFCSYRGVFFQPSIPPCGVAVFVKETKFRIARYDGFQIEDTMCLQCELRMVGLGGVENNKNTGGALHFFNLHFCGGKQPGDEQRRARHVRLLHENCVKDLLSSSWTSSGAPVIVCCDSNSERGYAQNEDLHPEWYPAVEKLWLQPNLFVDVCEKAKLAYTTKKKRDGGKVTKRCVDYVFVSTHAVDGGGAGLSAGSTALDYGAGRRPSTGSGSAKTNNFVDEHRTYEEKDRELHILEDIGVLDVPRSSDRLSPGGAKSNKEVENYMPNDDFVSDHLPILCTLGWRDQAQAKNAGAIGPNFTRRRTGFWNCMFGDSRKN